MKRKPLTCRSFVPTIDGEYIPFENLTEDEKTSYAKKLDLAAAQAIAQSQGYKTAVDEKSYTLTIYN